MTPATPVPRPITALHQMVTVGLFVVLVTAIVGGLDAATTEELRLPATLEEQVALARAEGEQAVATDVEHRISHPTAGERVLANVSGALWLATAGAVLWLLREVLDSARREDPFTEQNAKLLRGAAFALAGGAALAELSGLLSSVSLSNRAPEGLGLAVAGSVDLLLPMAGAFGLAAVGEVFRHGVHLRRETEGLI